MSALPIGSPLLGDALKKRAVAFFALGSLTGLEDRAGIARGHLEL